MTRRSRPLLPSVLLLATAAAALAAAPAGAGAVPFDSDRWTFDAEDAEVEEFLGRRSLRLKGGLAWVDGEPFVDGEVEFDIAFERQRGYHGAVWRLQDAGNYEHFYLRPHQSGNPDANQYTPVFHGSSGWQLYHGPAYGTPLDYRFGAWQHVKIVFAGSRAEVYVDSGEPVLFVPELKREARSGKVGLSAGGPFAVHFSNFSYRPVEGAILKGGPPPPEPVPGLVRRWQVSSVFDGSRLADVTELEGFGSDLTWTPLDAESTGITNLARLAPMTREARTVFARVTLLAVRAETRKVRFGYSDEVQVYLNGRLLYGGQRRYRSRDYRYLGTIGLFDELYLPLEEGENDLRFAVSEAFGGWGIVAAIESP